MVWVRTSRPSMSKGVCGNEHEGCSVEYPWDFV